VRPAAGATVFQSCAKIIFYLADSFGFALLGESLFFVSPKKSNPKKGDPKSRLFPARFRN
jgi:hypothetical protein